MNQSFAFVIAWPETRCRKADSWYDPLMKTLGFCIDDHYKVGHAAIVLINGKTGKAYYFDFGRYNTRDGRGRVRDESSDPSLRINSIIDYDETGHPLIDEMIYELNENDSCMGTGYLRGGLFKINFDLAFSMAKGMQEHETIPYGPFIINGTNCSRFVRTVALSGATSITQMSKLAIAPMITPTPMWNVRAVGEYRMIPESVMIEM